MQDPKIFAAYEKLAVHGKTLCHFNKDCKRQDGRDGAGAKYGAPKEKSAPDERV